MNFIENLRQPVGHGSAVADPRTLGRLQGAGQQKSRPKAAFPFCVIASEALQGIAWRSRFNCHSERSEESEASFKSYTLQILHFIQDDRFWIATSLRSSR
jgi:hypothetical protein